MISLPWTHVARARAAAEADRERMRRELEASQQGEDAAVRKRSWVESIVAPISERYRENHFGRDVKITYTPRGPRAQPADGDH